jgi:hypothetical protein
MKKITTLIAGLGAIAVLLAITTFGGNSGVSDPVVSLTKLSATGGRAQHDAIVTDLNSLATATIAVIDVADSMVDGTATVTLGANKLWVGNDTSNQTAMAVAGDVTITQDGTNVTTAIASGVIVNADIASNAAIVSTKLATAAQTSLGLADTAYQPNGVNLLTEGYFDVVGTTQLVFIASGVTNVIDIDITTP